MTQYPVLAMLMSEQKLQVRDIHRKTDYCLQHLYRMLRGDLPITDEVKDLIYDLLGPLPITKKELFMERGDPDIYKMLLVFSTYKKKKKAEKALSKNA